MPSRDDYDRIINRKWAEAGNPAPPDEKATIAGAKAIYRKAMGRAWKGKVRITSGKRYTWIRNGTLIVNVTNPWEPGWRGVAHQLSHWAHYCKNPRDRPHSDRQAILEAELTNYVLSDAFAKYRSEK